MDRTELAAGHMIGDRYRILSLTGEGRFSLLYRVLDQRLQRPAALKELFPEGMAERCEDGSVCFPALRQEERQELIRSFSGEAVRMAALSGTEGIPQVSDVFQDNGTVYIVMACMDGIPLREELRLRGGRMSAGDIIGLFLPLAGILEQIHTRGFLHRDISPDNVLIDGTGRPCLIDLGSAEDEYTGTGQRTVNDGFSPYEQYLSDGKTGPWTDIYALGALLYLCACGVEPPAAAQRLDGQLGSGRNWGSSAFLLPVIEKAMAPEPSRRYPSAAAFGEALKAAYRRRRRRLAVLGIAAAAAAMVSILVMTGLTSVSGGTEIYAAAETVREGEAIPGLSGCYEIRSCLDGSLLWAVSREAGPRTGGLIVWTQVWDETQQIWLEEQAEGGVYRIKTVRNGREFCLSAENRGILRFVDRSGDRRQLFRIIAGGEDTCLIQSYNTDVAGIGSDSGQGSAVYTGPYESFGDTRAVHWLLHRSEAHGMKEARGSQP